MNQLDDLTQRAVSAPVAPPPPMEQIRQRATRNHHRRIGLRLAASVCAIGLVILVAATLLRSGSDNHPSVLVGPPSAHATTRLVVPPIGKARPARLSDGTPVWVVHHGNDTLSVVSAISTHTPDGLQQLTGWCPSLPGFEDGMYGSTWDEYGRRIGGPAPTDLPIAKPESRSSGRLVVGPLQPAVRDTPRQPVTDQTQTCFSNLPTGYDPGTSQLHTYSASDATTIQDVTRQVEAPTSSKLAYVPNAALVVAPNNTVRLCAARASAQATLCRGPIVKGIDASNLRQNHPAAFQIIKGALLLRPQHGAVGEITFTDGYTITTFSPSS